MTTKRLKPIIKTTRCALCGMYFDLIHNTREHKPICFRHKYKSYRLYSQNK